MHLWKGKTQEALVMCTFLMFMPVMARYSSGAAILYDILAVCLGRRGEFDVEDRIKSRDRGTLFGLWQ